MFDIDDVDEAKRMLPIYKRAVDLLETVSGKKTEQAQQEPVAWGMPSAGGGFVVDCITPEEHDRVEGGYTIPLYTSPPASKPWVGLTDEEIRDLEKQFNAERVRTSDEEYLIIYPSDYWAWQRAIEAKLREKNA